MTASKTRPVLSSTLPRVLDGYDFDAETERAREAIPDTVVLGQRLNRATAKVTFREDEAWAAPVRQAHREAVFSSTLDADSPVLELGWPTAGHYVMDRRGVHFDLYLGVGQKIFDDHHPALVRAVRALDAAGLMLRREINTDDFLRIAPQAEGVHAPHELAAMLDSAVSRAFPGTGAWRTFFTNSGTEAVEAALKLAYQVRYKRFVAQHGAETLAKVMTELGIREFKPLAVDKSRPETIFEDYPFFVIGCDDAFHGRTLGSLSLTASKKAQKLGYPRLRWVRHVPVNTVGALAAAIDPTPLAEHLANPGSLRRTIDAGRVPADLFAAFVVEAVQGEGGYVPCTSEFLKDVEAACKRFAGLFVLDEVQTFGRTGTPWFAQQLGASPDAICMAKGLFVGAMVARADLDPHLHTGWHSNTWGGGKVFDNQVAYAVLDTLLHERSALFLDRSYPENEKVKGALVEAGLAELRARHPSLVEGHMVRGVMCRISLRRRQDVVRAGWKRGLKLLTCGRPGEVAAIRMLFLADVLAKEVRDAMDLLDQTLSDVESSPAS